MKALSSADTLLPRDSGQRTHVAALSPDLLAQSARRLRVVVILYAVAFFTSDPLTAFFFPEERANFLSSVLRWGPSTFSIAAALALAALTWNRRIAVGTVLILGLVFEVIGSFGIAAAQYDDVTRYVTEPASAGLSWVAVWMLGFTVIIPSPPRWALVAALASASSVPLVVGFVVAMDPVLEISRRLFFFQFVVPYVLVVMIAYVRRRTRTAKRRPWSWRSPRAVVPTS